MLVEQVSAVGQATPVCRIDCAKLQLLVATSISPEVVAPTKPGTVLTVLTSAWVSERPGPALVANYGGETNSFFS